MNFFFYSYVRRLLTTLRDKSPNTYHLFKKREKNNENKMNTICFEINIISLNLTSELTRPSDGN